MRLAPLMLALGLGLAACAPTPKTPATAPVDLGPYGARTDRWTSIDHRLNNLDRRIDQGVRTGQITRNEAVRLRGEFRSLVNLERRYSANGLTRWERADLDRRFDTLSARIRWDRHDNDRYSWGYGPRR